MNYLSNLKSSYSAGNLAGSTMPPPGSNLSASTVGSSGTLSATSKIKSGIISNLSSSSLSSFGSSYSGVAGTSPTTSSSTASGTLIMKTGPSEPVLVTGKLIKWLETKGLSTQSVEELFEPAVLNKNGAQFDFDKLNRNLMKDGDAVNLTGVDPLIVGEVLKQYLLRIEPLTTEEMYDAFMLTSVIKNYQDKVKYIRSLLIVLPKFSQILLKQLINLFEILVELRQHKISTGAATDLGVIASQNTPPAHQLAVIFAPILFRPAEVTYYMDHDSEIAVEITDILIKEHSVLMKAIDTFNDTSAALLGSSVTV